MEDPHTKPSMIDTYFPLAVYKLPYFSFPSVEGR
jgi:hypothetical protein